ncbi:hypothetical protein GCK72_011166 [Caenorhabditis remanei]|nr:hypothetical protein GCK72_011166 [Caenorhabditis remanei]KAF1762902.1 hypothetical protein GCK72_011166 [Caenorhabditis remanei]
MLFINSPVWSCLSGSRLETPVLTRYRTTGTSLLPFGGQSLEDFYCENFGVGIEHLSTPIVMDKITPHALEFLWVRTSEEVSNSNEEEEEEEKVGDKFDFYSVDGEITFENYEDEFEFRR